MAAERALIKTKLDEEEARLRRLGVEHEEAKARLVALRSGLAALDEGPVQHLESSSSGMAIPQSALEKVTLFRQLFRGREDLYPTRFVSKKTGKAGYAPACTNKFVAGLCELPKVKCGDCANQAFRPVDDSAVLRHLHPLTRRVGVVCLLRFPRRLIHADRVMLVLLARRLLPLPTHAFPRANRVVGRAGFRALDGHALVALTSCTQNVSARRADLRDAVFGENSLRELRARLVFAPRPELGLTEPIDPHAVTSDMNRNLVSRKPAVGSCRGQRGSCVATSRLPAKDQARPSSQ
jgi:hypothetical protein